MYQKTDFANYVYGMFPNKPAPSPHFGTEYLTPVVSLGWTII